MKIRNLILILVFGCVLIGSLPVLLIPSLFTDLAREDGLLYAVFGVFGVSLAASLLLALLFAKGLSRSLVEFAAQMSHSAKGTELHPVEIPGRAPAEVLTLIGAFNRLVADHRQAERERETLADHHAAILAAVPDILAEVDNKQVYTWTNPAGFAFFGEDCIGRPVADFFTDAQDTLEQVRPLFEGREDLVHLESWQRRKDGTNRLLAWWCVPLRDEVGGVRGALSLARDITEQWQAEKELRASSSALREAQEAGTVGLYILDVQEGTWTSSAVLDAIFGIGPDFTRTISGWLSLVHPAHRDEMKEYFAATLARHRRFEKEYRIIRPEDGSERWVLGIGEVEYDLDGVPLFMAGTIQDITERHKLEEQVRQSQKMESIGTLASGIAHDFNNILTAIMGYGQISLLDLDAEDPRRANIQGILDAAARGAQLTKDILLFSRKQVSDRRPTELSEVVRKIEKFLKRVIGEDIVCRIILPDRPLRIMADGHQIEQVLMNFATNARDAMPDGGSFELRAEQVEIRDGFMVTHGFGIPGPYAQLTVSDTGRGMSEAVRQRIFEPFFTTKEAEKGTGLGMAVVYGIVKQHEGYINVYSEPGKGSVFRVYLPLLPEEGGAEAQSGPVAPELPPGGTETILLAEDDEQIRKMIRAVLEQFGYTILEAADGEEAVRVFGENAGRIDLLFFDLVMPNMSGPEALAAIRRTAPQIKVLFTSGYAEETLRQRTDVGADTPILVKPTSPVDLLRRVRAVLDEPASA